MGDGHTPQNRASNRRKSIFEVLQMDVFPVNWDSVPEVMNKELPEDTLRQMHGYYEKPLRKYPDVVTVKDVVTLTGYTLTTVHNWCSRGSLKAFQKGLKFCIPKIFLVDFFCSLTFRSITRKSLWHIQTLNEFSRKMKK